MEVQHVHSCAQQDCSQEAQHGTGHREQFTGMIL